MSEQDATALDPKLTHFIAIGNNHGWGRGETEAEAIRKMHSQGKRASEFFVYRCTPESFVNDMGGFTRPGADPAPVKIRHTQKKTA